MRTIIGLYFVVCFFLQSSVALSKTIRLNNRLPLREQMTESNTTYEFIGTFDLGGQIVPCPSGSCLKFKKECLVLNGCLEGNYTRIRAGKRVKSFMENVILTGHFSNNKSYLSWWKIKDDITSEINSLTSSFDGHIYLDRGGAISNSIYIWNKHNIVIDGCNNTFSLRNVPNNCFFAQKNKQIEFRNISIVFDGCNTRGGSAILRCFRAEHCEQSSVSIHDISIRGFSNINDVSCSFNGINVTNCGKGTTTNIYNIRISDIMVKGDGKEIVGPGGNYGVVVSCSCSESGVVRVSNCQLFRMGNITSDGSCIYEDTSGIYLAGKFSERGSTQDCHWNALITDCFFEDISKRNIKVQGDYVIIENMKSNCTHSFLKDFKNMYVGAEGNHLTINNIQGRYDGMIIKITGDYLSVNGVNCSSSLSNSGELRVFTLDGCHHAHITDCSFDNNNYIFIYPTEKWFEESVIPHYSFSNCTLNVKHILYCVTKQPLIFNKGVLIVNDSDIRLSQTICSNGQALDSVVFNRSKVIYQKDLSYPKNNSRSIRVYNNGSILKQER